MTAAIKIDNLGKRYSVHRAYHGSNYKTLRESVMNSASAAFRRFTGAQGNETDEDFWALKGLDIEIQAGEVAGVIGRNGAGKSTLLKILSRITKPTTGHAEIHGRVGSLLEVGTGFHPELSGRENIFLNGAILGMSRREIMRLFDEIVDFSEIEDFLDMPVKRYSSGMYVRLAFAVAAHLEPEILLVDEVLAVGDAGFQKKCIRKMQDVTKQGRTILFVSHNMGSMGSLCEQVFWLEHGRLKQHGDAKLVISQYMSEGAINQERFMDLSAVTNSHEQRFTRLTIQALEWLSDVPPKHGEPFSIRIHYKANANATDVSCGIGFCTVEGTRILTIDSDYLGVRQNLPVGRAGWVEMTIDELPLGPGVYSLDIGARSGDSHGLDYRGGFSLIEVLPGPITPQMLAAWPGSGVRMVPKCHWDFE